MRPTAPANRAEPIAVWLIEDHDDCRRMVMRVINQIEGMHCPRAFASCEEALAALAQGPPPRIVLSDVGLPGMNGIAGIQKIKFLSPATDVILLTVYDDPDKIFSAICAGASGYLLKNSSEETIVSSIQEVVRGGAPMNPKVARRVLDMFARFAPASTNNYGLTDREKEILELMVKGLIKKEIAAQLDISFHTVDNHLRSIYGKLHVNTRSGAVAKALREKLF
mgnify:CR=1 FL=1